MNTTGINPSWLDWIPGYFLIKRAPTAQELALYELHQAKKTAIRAELDLVKARAEVVKQETILRHLTGAG
jgi:hypothetical protein